MKKQTVIILVVAGAVLAVLGVIAVVGIALAAWLFLSSEPSAPMPAPSAAAAMPDTSAPAETLPRMAVPVPPWPPAAENLPPGEAVPAPLLEPVPASPVAPPTEARPPAEPVPLVEG